MNFFEKYDYWKANPGAMEQAAQRIARELPAARETLRQAALIESDDYDLQCEFEYCNYGDEPTDVLTQIETFSYGRLRVCDACVDGFKSLTGDESELVNA